MQPLRWWRGGPDRLKALKAEIEGKGGKAIAVEADVTDRAGYDARL